MKFKKSEFDGDVREIIVKEKGGADSTLVVQTREDGKPGLFINTNDGGIFLTGKQSLKLAWAIIDELNPDVLA
jgi:hypothetical protein